MRKIIVSFTIFLVLFIGNFLFPVSSAIGLTARMWLILDICVFFLSVFLLIKVKLPSVKYRIVSLLFGLSMFLAYGGIGFSSLKGFVITTLCALASFSVFCSHPANAVPLVKEGGVQQLLLSLLLGLGIGGVLGAVNLTLSGGQALSFNPTLRCFLTAISPGILEEVCYRLVLFAYCLYLLGGKIRSRSESFWCYLLMVTPHVLIHTPDTFLNYGLISGIVNVLLLSLLFGWPFAILQRKRDLTSAMVAHGFVDVIRFSFLGLPF